MRALGIIAALAGSLVLSACSWHTPEPAPLSRLAINAAELELHLRDDSYRSFAHLTPDGRNVFEVLRWRLERHQRQRPSDPAAWSAEDAVLEFARARTLERLRLYREASEAYARVAALDSRLAGAATDAARVMVRFGSHAKPLEATEPAAQLPEIDERIATWMELANGDLSPGYASLAREEAESWEILRVELIERERGIERALRACGQLVERHRDSKLYPRHLLRLGDLHLEAAREEVLRARTERAELIETDYDRHLEAALSAYELASEARNKLLRLEAQSRIQSLLAYHDGVRSHAY